MRQVKWGSREYDVIEKPVPHIIISALSNTPVTSGRWGLKTDNVPKACVMDVLHLSPYKGCTVGCEFCSLPQYRGFNLLYSKHGVSVVFEDYDAYVYDILSRASFVHTFDFGADADALMPGLEDTYHMTERTINVLNRYGLPATVTSKCRWPDGVITALSKNRHSWAQISITGMESKTVIDDIAKDASRIKLGGLKLTARLQPYVVGVSRPLEELVPEIKAMGFDNLVFGFLRAPMGKGRKMLEHLSARSDVDLSALYHEKYPGYWQIDQDTSLEYLEVLKDLCEESQINLGLCDVYARDENGAIQSMQPLFGSCRSCECQNGYGWVKKPGEDIFSRVVGCPGNCLLCDEETPACGIPEFAKSVMTDIKGYQKLYAKYHGK